MMGKIPRKNVCSSPGSDAYSRRNQATTMRFNSKYQFIPTTSSYPSIRTEFAASGYSLVTKTT